MYKHAITALATAATSVVLVASPATAEETRPATAAEARACVPAAVAPQSTSDVVDAFSDEVERLVERLVQVLTAGPAASWNQPATPMLDQAGARALLGEFGCASVGSVPTAGVAATTGTQPAATPEAQPAATDDKDNCLSYKVGPGWAPNWPMLDALGIRELILQSSGVATLCVVESDDETTPEQTPSTTAVHPQPQTQTQQQPSQPQTQVRQPSAPGSQVAQQPVQTAPRIRNETRVTQVRTESNRAKSNVNVSVQGTPLIGLGSGEGSLLDRVGVTAQLRLLAGITRGAGGAEVGRRG